ncbi:RHS repeat-associated core domain-containing protein [Niabella pedocola]|uniref:RHS repeat-associated core domain-containing protein n=1 Tax=Niabella pedocola TaxID=1752077 RepID=A0ABS8PK23_9BACT|nr:DUF6443 domain-containing protein [Niabella pedocola]MCD2421225.1 RHS repeat-associated core domain-containing protein [Niabella pedocola]
MQISNQPTLPITYRFILLSVLFVLPLTMLRAQITPSNDQNFIYTRKIIKEGVKTAADLSALPVDSMRAEIQYLDGLGRSLQSVAVRSSPDKKDIVIPVAYDAVGRQNKVYLPYEATSNNGIYQIADVTSQALFYNSAGAGSISKIAANPFTQTLFEPSPLSRVHEVANPGASWKLGNGHTTRIDYGVNGANEIRRWEVTILGTSYIGATSPSYYGAGQLSKTTTWDENRNRVIEYKDKEGMLVCKMVQDGGDTLSAPTFTVTQYIYDDFDQLAYVLPPALQATTSFTETSTDFLNYIFAYHFDSRRRIIEKKMPGKGWEYTVYNANDQPVLKQDSIQRERGVWVFMKYDTLGRLIMTGETANADSRGNLQANADARTVLFEVRDNTLFWGYSNRAIPTTISKIHTVNFYDDYSFLSSTVNQNPIQQLLKVPAGTDTETNRTHGLPTITITNVLDSNKYLYAGTYYDEKGRITKVVSQHLLNGADVISNALNFAGEITSTTRAHYKDNFASPALSVVRTQQYDHAGRIVRAIETINGQPADTITYTFNQIGQLAQKKVGNQIIKMFYNERGWVKKQESPLFTMDLKYDSAAVGNKQFNGNIGQQLWKSGSGVQVQHTYSYNYDRANRIISGVSDEGYNEQDITYDNMGNIKTLTRSKDSPIAISYDYGTKGNQLQAVTGGYTRSYVYNGNGSVSTIAGTQPLTMIYNELNLPKQISGSTTVDYVYDAKGSKLKKITPSETRWYVDGIEYLSNTSSPSPTIDLLNTTEGVARRSGGVYNYEYFLKDHLGNTRIVFDKLDAVLQQTDYYPFGISILRKVYNQNKYLFNGKEQQQELGGGDKGQYDFGARFYDPVIGRWQVIDPLADLSKKWSPYSYAYDNPLRFVDPDGMAAEDTVITVTKSEVTLDKVSSSYVPDKTKKGKTAPTGNDVVTEETTRKEEATVEVFDDEGKLEKSFKVKYTKHTTTTVVVNRDGEVVSVSQKETEILNSPGKVDRNTTEKSFSENNLIGTLKDAVNYVKQVKKETGYSPSQLRGEREKEIIGFFGLPDLTLGGAAQLGRKQVERALGSFVGRALGRTFWIVGAAATIATATGDFTGRTIWYKRMINGWDRK